MTDMKKWAKQCRDVFEQEEQKCLHPVNRIIELNDVDEYPYPSYTKVKCLDCGKTWLVEIPS